MKEHKNFWDKNAGRYDRFMQKDRAAYDEMYVLIRRRFLLRKVKKMNDGKSLMSVRNGIFQIMKSI